MPDRGTSVRPKLPRESPAPAGADAGVEEEETLGNCLSGSWLVASSAVVRITLGLKIGDVIVAINGTPGRAHE